jgi:hypothetical protein
MKRLDLCNHRFTRGVVVEWRIGVADERSAKQMTSEAISTLGQVLRNADEISWTHSLYLPYSVSWNLDTPCMVIDSAATNDGAENITCGGVEFEYALGMQQVQGIVRNALAQKPGARESDLLSAFLHYYDNDAFIQFVSAKPAR